MFLNITPGNRERISAQSWPNIGKARKHFRKKKRLAQTIKCLIPFCQTKLLSFNLPPSFSPGPHLAASLLLRNQPATGPLQRRLATLRPGRVGQTRPGRKLKGEKGIAIPHPNPNVLALVNHSMGLPHFGFFGGWLYVTLASWLSRMPIKHQARFNWNVESDVDGLGCTHYNLPWSSFPKQMQPLRGPSLDAMTPCQPMARKVRSCADAAAESRASKPGTKSFVLGNAKNSTHVLLEKGSKKVSQVGISKLEQTTGALASKPLQAVNSFQEGVRDPTLSTHQNSWDCK